MDDIDRAQQLEQSHRERSIKNARIAEGHQQNKIGDRIFCIDCDTEIPDERLEASPHACRCISCQESHELGWT